MKKILFLSLVALLAASCSNDDEQTVTKTKLVKAEMKVSASQTITSRAYLGHIDQTGGSKVTGVKFQSGDKMDIYENCSYSDGTKYVFTDQDDGAYQNANFKGEWSEDLGAWTAIFPSSSNNRMTSMSDATDGNGTNIFESVIPQSQKTIQGPDNGVTYENAANVMVAANYHKENVNTPTCLLAPIVCYLYFASSQETVNIVSTAGSICGSVKCTTSKNTWSDWEGFRDCCTSIVGTDASAKTIQSKGIYMDRSSKYEHIVCMIPGTFEAGQLTIGNLTNSNKQVLKHVNMYYLGDIDE